jgi:hypothetical protein
LREIAAEKVRMKRSNNLLEENLTEENLTGDDLDKESENPDKGEDIEVSHSEDPLDNT